ncbi:MAG TPA: antibiotic biosynthesis monooxygenase [Pseudomonas sp.]|nr:antibiotic biosynthesis monooxygenase [Pseudomonas sp.]
MSEHDMVTLVIQHQPKPGREADYEGWLRRITRVAAGYPGHLGVNVIRDGSRFVCVLRFNSTPQLQAWLDSSDRHQLIEEVSPLLVADEQLQVEASHEFWFTPSSPAAPPRWKQACITYLVIQPLTLLVPQLWQPLFSRVPWLGGYVPSNVLITLTIVLSVVYLFMPRVTAWFAGWLNVR